MRSCSKSTVSKSSRLFTRDTIFVGLITICILAALLTISIPAKSAEKSDKPDAIVLTIIEKVQHENSMEKLVRIAAILDEDKQPSSQASTASSGPYTSLIVDARGLGVERSISPKVYKLDSTEVWGTMSVTPDYAIDHGIAGFVTGMEDAAKCERSGKNPLIVKAIGAVVRGGRKEPIVSDADAALIQSENAKTKFADKCKVIFVVDK